MGISRLTAMIIQNGKIRIAASKRDKNGKYAGWIMQNEDKWAPLISTAPIYDSKKQAQMAMKDLVEAINRLDLVSPFDVLLAEEKETIGAIINAAKNKTIQNL